jgi:protein-tyrosine phosphatase
MHFPIPNYGIPSADQLTRSLNQTIQAAMHGRHILIHRSAGLGRTTLYVAFLAKTTLNLSGTEALRWVGILNARALLTPAQILVLLSDRRGITLEASSMTHLLDRLPITGRSNT